VILFLFILFFVLLYVGVPIAFALTVSSVLSIALFTDVPILIAVQRMFAGLDVFALMAIPLFLFAGYLMTEVRLSERLVAFASIFLGRFRGGLSLIATGSSAVFGAISGSANATTAAIGSVMIPTMAKRGYDEDHAAAVVAASGILGLIIPPSITMVLYGVAANVSIGDLFLNGIVPGLLIAACLLAVNYAIAVRNGYQPAAPLSRAEMLKAARQAVVPMLMPLIILGGIYSGAFTPTEAAAVACGYGLLVGAFVYRNLSVRALFRISRQTAEMSAVILFLIASANIFTYVLASQNVPQSLAAALIGLSDSPQLIMVLIMLALLALGTFLDNVAAVVLITPTLMPVLAALDIDPMFFGVFMVTAIAVGQITPPVGLNLFIAANLTNSPFEKVVVASFPYIALYVVILFVFIAFPGLLTVF
jgi:C4-dicarboxylate transporter, DctM subunit